MCMSEDSIPLISQLKSLILLLRGDKFGARETQRAFICQCMIISQIYSLFKHLWLKDTPSAMDIQFEFYRSTFIAVPIISQLLSIMLCFRCQFDTAWRIQQIFLNQLTDLLFFPIRFVMYLLHPWPRIIRPLHGLHPINHKIKKIRKKSKKWLEFLKKTGVGEKESEKLKEKDKEKERESDGIIPLKCWMKEFEEYPLSYLTLPGTHNAHAYKFQWAVSFLNNFTVNQHWDVYRQLKNGARCLDVRVGKSSNGEIVCAHRAFVSVKFEKVMKHVGKYVNKYPSEIVVLRIKCEEGWTNNRPQAEQLIDIAKKYVANRLAPLFCDNSNETGTLYRKVLDMRIKDLLARQWNVVLFYEFRYNDYQMITSWLETHSEMPKPLLRNIAEWVERVPDNKKIFRKQYFRGEDEHNNASKTSIVLEENRLHRSESLEGSELKDGVQILSIKKEDRNEETIISSTSVHKDENSVSIKESDSNSPQASLGLKKWYLVNAQVTAKFTITYIFHQLIHGMFGLRCDVEFVTGHLMKKLNAQMIHKVNVIECDFLHPLLVRKIINVNRYYCGFISPDEIDELEEDEQVLI